MKRNTFIRVLCAALCAAVFLGTFTILFSAVNAAGDPTDDEVAVTEEVVVEPADGDDDGEEVTTPADDDDEEEAPAADVAAAPISSNGGRRAVDWFFRTFGFIGFILDPYQFTIINQRPVFQFLLGFNDFYDMFPFVMNVYADMMKFEFNHNGKDWRIQLWKGGYGIFLATGGEIGIYQKGEGNKINHYICPPSQNDWLNLEMTIYNRGKKLFTRPSPDLGGDTGPYWWCPGYKILSICTDFLSNPRKNVVMDATLVLHDAGMAQKFADMLKDKGFTELAQGADMGLSTPESYQLLADGQSVRLIWQFRNESWY